ncbi:hypothetical protein GMDG_08940, partial [Pseudogymnoascus destructans 20631-21]
SAELPRLRSGQDAAVGRIPPGQHPDSGIRRCVLQRNPGRRPTSAGAVSATAARRGLRPAGGCPLGQRKRPGRRRDGLAQGRSTAAAVRQHDQPAEPGRGYRAGAYAGRFHHPQADREAWRRYSGARRSACSSYPDQAQRNPQRRRNPSPGRAPVPAH